MNTEKAAAGITVGLIVAYIIGFLAFWGGVLFVIVHFVHKVW